MISDLFKHAKRQHPRPELWDRIANDTVSSEWRIPSSLAAPASEGDARNASWLINTSTQNSQPITKTTWQPHSIARFRNRLAISFGMAALVAAILAVLPHLMGSAALIGRQPATTIASPAEKETVLLAKAGVAAGESLIDTETLNWLVELGENTEPDEVFGLSL